MLTKELQNNILNKFINLKYLKTPVSSRAIFNQLPITLTHLFVTVKTSQNNSEQTYSKFGKDESLALVLRCPDMKFIRVKRIHRDGALVLSHLTRFKTLKIEEPTDSASFQDMRPGIEVICPARGHTFLEIRKNGER
eukprot:TRINITY_DN7428_c0_g1_i1.p1 TRINITY_DN7428_c0_g1~~TRINITY_DN7428_c0_g1_i1.p1  ORF type:complete len:137 (-),score=16.59 TRINITY_DN7428_c0_g1_i1:169-579(-)